MRWLWWLVLAIAAFGGFRYYQSVSQGRRAAAPPRAAGQQGGQPVSVAAAPITTGNLPIVLSGLGTVTAYNTVNVKSRVDGPIVKVNFTEGQNVKQGEVLLQIDPRPLQVALEQAQGQQARDQAQLKDAQTNLARYQTLWQEGVIPKQQLDTQAAQVDQFKGTLETDQGAIDNAKLQLSFTNITAPIGGRIGLRQVDVGNIVHASDPNALAVITQIMLGYRGRSRARQADR
jgi:multidrug efflux system membrane fusion protein